MYAYANTTKNDTKEELEKNYCTRKYIVDNNFINTTVYNVNLNPMNIDVLGVDCDEIMKEIYEKLLNAYIRDPTDQSSRAKCIQNVSRAMLSLQAYARVIVLGEIGISDEEKAKEKQAFIEATTPMFEKLVECA